DIFRDAPSLDGPTILPFSGERRRSSASVPRPQGRLRAARAGVHPLQRRVGRRSRGVVLLSTTAPVRSDDSDLSVTRSLAGWAVRHGMARTQLAAIVEASGILQAVALARIGGRSEALLVGVERTDEN